MLEIIQLTFREFFPRKKVEAVKPGARSGLEADEVLSAVASPSEALPTRKVVKEIST